MNALHPKTNHWIRQGVFDDLKSFADFEARVNEIPEEKDRGDIFEIFIEGYLATQSITQRIAISRTLREVSAAAAPLSTAR